LEAPKQKEMENGDAAGATGLVYDDVFLDHKTGRDHPERPERLTAIVGRLQSAGLLARLVRIEPAAADAKWFATVHEDEYVDRLRRSCRQGAGFLDSPDTPVSERSYEVAAMAAGGVLGAVDAVMEGSVRNAFCAVRPPGHHALGSRAMGFCLLNNVAIAARYVQKKHNLAKVLVVDWDVHHGNGTQAVFYDDPGVLYFSTHQYPFYPGTGSVLERGEGAGLGYTINAPLPSGCGDPEYHEVFDEVLKPAALQYRPDFVFISAGFDAHALDPLGGMRVTSQGFGKLTETVRRIAETCCGGRVISMLEGGYDLDGLAESVAAHLRVLMQ